MESFAFGVAEAREQFVMDRFGVSLELPKILPAGVGEAEPLGHVFQAGDPIEPVYNLGSGDGVSVGEIMSTMAAVTGIPFTPEIAPRRGGDPDRIVASGELARRDLNWEMRHSLGAMVQSAWDARRAAA